MKLFKKSMAPVLAMSALALSLVVPSSSFATDSNPDLSHIEKKLLNKLHKAGFSDLQIATLSNEVLQDLKETKVLKKVESEVIERGEIITDPNTGETVNKVEYKRGSVTPQSTGDLNMSLTVDAWEVTSDHSGEKKFIIVSGYNWNSVPANRYTDALSIGWPASTGWYLPTSGGSVAQFYANDYYVNDASPSDITYRYISTSTPDDAASNAGVGHEIDLPGVITALDFYGGMQQYVYVDADITGDTNIKTVYGHAKTTLTPSFGVYPAGLTVEPGTTIVQEYSITTLNDW